MKKFQKGFAHLFLIVIIVIIGIGGLLYYSWQKGLIKTTPPNNVSLTPAAMVDETANWKVYRNEDGVFSFRYPPDAGIFKSKIGVTIAIPGDKSIGESLTNSFINLTFETIQKDLQSIEDIARLNYMQINPQNSEVISEIQPTEVNGYSGFTYKVRDKIAFGFDTTYIYLESSNKQYYMVIVSTIEDNNNLGYQKLHDQILSTFKFTD